MCRMATRASQLHMADWGSRSSLFFPELWSPAPQHLVLRVLLRHLVGSLKQLDDQRGAGFAAHWGSTLAPSSPRHLLLVEQASLLRGLQPVMGRGASLPSPPLPAPSNVL